MDAKEVKTETKGVKKELTSRDKMIYELKSIFNTKFFFFITNISSIKNDVKNPNPSNQLFYKIKNVGNFLKFSSVYRYINEKKILKRVIVNKAGDKCVVRCIVPDNIFSLWSSKFKSHKIKKNTMFKLTR